ncbi:MAG: N-acetylmuramoyl-L-alanine amidase [Firmicutes bacterium]|nr:N-acetylmuramoyl-L-alanine amidase [Bacillota bacterium]
MDIPTRGTRRKPLICLDAGHGGNDPGAVSPPNLLKESEINLAAVLSLGKILEQNGCEVLYTRRLNVATCPSGRRVGINARAEYANAHNADFFISIHTNAGGGQGAETFIAPNDQTSRNFAETVNTHYSAKMGLRNRGVKLDTTTRHGSLGVLRNTKMPAILLELAFIDAPSGSHDVQILWNILHDSTTAAQALADGVLKFLRSQNHVNVDNHPNDSNLQVDIFGEIHEITAINIDGKNYVGLREIGEKLGFIVNWDEIRKIPTISKNVKIEKPTKPPKTHNFTFDEIRLLETVVHWESRGEDLKGQILVANVILNRMRNNNACLADVIFHNGAFTVVERADFYLPAGQAGDAEPSELTKNAVKQAINGTDYSQGAMFFHAISHLTADSWHERAAADGRIVHLFDHGNHRFYR